MPKTTKRLGFHYFPDTTHYRKHDLQTWLPELDRLGASWLTLKAPHQRAIPEYFLEGLIKSGIQPVLHFELPTDGSVSSEDLRPLLRNYAHWGVQYIAVFDRPNCQRNWSPAAWAQPALVERFLDLFLPVAELIFQEGMKPIFPPLQPGGDYWDLAFLRMALQALKRRGKSDLLDALILGAYAWVGSHSLDWGLGGPDRWPGARPYFTPEGIQDHLGFRIFDWYQSVAEHALGLKLPVMILAGGYLPPEMSQPDEPDAQEHAAQHARQNLALARIMNEDEQDAGSDERVPPEVLTCNFWLLAADEGSDFYSQAWFRPEGEPLPVVNAFRRWVQSLNPQKDAATWQPPEESAIKTSNEGPIEIQQDAIGKSANIGQEQKIAGGSHPIEHYVLLPLYAWGSADWDMDLIRKVFKEAHPTLGFSINEASHARRVTVAAGEGAFPRQALEMLQSAGCQVERLAEDGTLVATVSISIE